MSGTWATPTAFPDLTPGQVHVWRVRTDAALPADADLLSDDERRRADAFRTETLRRRHVASHAALRRVLGGCLGVSGATLRFGFNPWGKPRLADGRIGFNLSHSGPWALVAVATNGEVGVDVETISHPPPLDVAGIAYSQAERSALAGLSGPALTAAFYAIWTRKEALSKGIGRGFSFDFTSFSVSIDPLAAVSRPVLPPDLASGAAWYLHNLPAIEGAVGALAVPGRRFEIATWQF